MKKRIFKILLILVGITIALILYLNSSYYIENQDWKYTDGNHIGDFLEKNTVEVKDRVIYANSGKAKIVFCFGVRLIIENIETGEKGFYVNKS